MNGSTVSPAAPSPSAALTSGETNAQIDASCRVLMLPILGSLVWLLLSSLFWLITSVKLHSPTVLANSAWLTYGHTRPAANDLFVYGFASQAGIAIALWILCRLGRNALVAPSLVVVGSLFWNIAVLTGTVGILAGWTTGFEWLEYPSAGSALLMASYLVLGIAALLTFKARRTHELYPSQWYILAALFWFPWLYTTARLLLVWFPVRGVMQLVVNGWFANGLFTLWLGSIAVAVLLYFIPKLSGAPLHSRALAVLGFWTLAIFGGFAGFYRGQPIPNWIISASIAATVILLVAIACVVGNLWLTLSDAKALRGAATRYFRTSAIFLVVSAILAVLAATQPQLRLTLLGEGMEQLALYGFIAIALFGAIDYIAPRLTGVECSRFLALNWWGTLIGVLVFGGVYVIGGFVQHAKLADGSIPFVEVMNGTKPFIRISTLGILLLIVGNFAILARVAGMVRDCCRNCCVGCCDEPRANVKLKPARAAR
jgi:cytochrome c oxidase cbb3-type subunit I